MAAARTMVVGPTVDHLLVNNDGAVKLEKVGFALRPVRVQVSIHGDLIEELVCFRTIGGIHFLDNDQWAFPTLCLVLARFLGPISKATDVDALTIAGAKHPSGLGLSQDSHLFKREW